MVLKRSSNKVKIKTRYGRADGGREWDGHKAYKTVSWCVQHDAAAMDTP